MKRRKALSLLLILTMLLSLVLPATSALADDDTSGGDGDKTKGMSISKTASYNESSKDYTITLEAFATGEKITSVVQKDVPTDIILVLDQSGSMANDIGTVSFNAYTGNQRQNNNLYNNRHNGGNSNLWYQPDSSKDSYVSVSVIRENKSDYTPINNGKNNSTSGSATNYWNNRNNLYALVNGEPQKVSVSRSGYGSNNRTYTYTLSGNTVIASSQGDGTSPTFVGIDDDVLYLLGTVTTYTYTYTDSNNDVQTIGTSTGTNTQFTDATLYRRTTSTTGGGSRLAALQTAVSNFADAVAEKAKGADGVYGTPDDVNHRIAVVGFAHGATAYNSGNTHIASYENTEVFIGSTQYTYGTAAEGQYANAFQNMNTQVGHDNVVASAGVLAANGGTYANLGIQMANGIFAANPVASGATRNRVMIVFSDGVPGESGYDSNIASSAIGQANTAKNTYGATVYTIGVFPGADATSAGSTGWGSSEADQGNYFLQRVSSNDKYPRSPSYYLSAGDHSSLMGIFKQISDNIEDGGSSTTLGSETVVKDIISPYFTLPVGADEKSIRLNTYDCTGKNGDTYTWKSSESSPDGASATVNGDQVSVSGFNFSENWCGTETAANGDITYRGKKLVISFEVKPQDNFLGGNSVDTNGGAYIYENGDAKEPLMEFEKPKVDVTIPDVGVTAADKNVYLLGEVTLDQLKRGAVVKADDGSENGITIDLSRANDPDMPYGLEQWKTEYVDITVAVKDKDGKDVTDKIGNLTEDTTYKLIVTVSPKNEASGIGPEVTAKSGEGVGNIYVFKPELTYKDSTAYYGETVPTDNDYSANKVGSDVWKHKGVEADPAQMIGEKPTLKIEYTPDSTKILDNKYTKQDVPVKATVKIGNEDVTSNTTFVHQPCNPDCGWTTPENPGDPAFLIHVETCTLTITKAGNVANEPFVFTVYKDKAKYTEVTIVGAKSVTIAELPIGKYSIEEHTGWSWRYKDPTYANNGVELNATNPTGTITCTNTKGNDKWLDGYSNVISNIFQLKQPTTDTGDTN